jgi:predicted dehydrogenase
MAYLWLLLWVPFITIAGTEKPACYGSNLQGITAPAPLRVGVVGLVHDHVNWILGRESRGDIQIVGIAEPNRELALKYSLKYGFSMNMVYPSLDAMVSATHPEAVTAFNPIFDHLQTVRYCAPRGIHVMVEKPLAVSWEHAREMAALARQYHINLLTNYETSWYGSAHAAYDSIHSGKSIGEVRKIIFHTGHQGPVEIGCSAEFLEWLTDPDLNGAGALTDFGCYGANLSTWMLNGATPQTVSCTTQHIKPELYPRVEDEATIVLTYPGTQVIIEASWNWPFGVKDMEVFGTDGIIYCRNKSEMEFRTSEKEGFHAKLAEPLPSGTDDPFALFYKVVKEGYTLSEFAPTGLENNLMVVKILEAARESSRTGQRIQWESYFD